MTELKPHAATTVARTILRIAGCFGVVLLSTSGLAHRAVGADTSQPVSALVAKRIAAQCSGKVTFVPGWLPSGFHLTSWQVFGHNVACDVGFAIRFRRGTSSLSWQAGGPETFQLRCSSSTGAAVARIDGRAVYRKVTAGIEKVWVCAHLGYPLPLLVFQRIGPDRLTTRVLERIAAGAHAVPPAVAPAGGYELPSVADVGHLSRRFASPLYLPTELPAGFLFSEWAFSRKGYDGRRWLSVTFGRNGLVIEWDVMSGVDRYGLDCPEKKTPLSPKPFAVIDGVTTFLNVGIHGGRAWRCITAQTVGNAKPIEVSLWYSILLDSPAMEREVSEIVADAQLVRT